MTGLVAQPTLNLPTGFESQQAQLALKQKLAQAMMSQSMESEPNMTSPLQVLGKLAETWAGKHKLGEVAKDQSALNAEMLKAYQARAGDLGSAMADPNVDPAKLVSQYGSDPMLAGSPQMDALKSAMISQLKGEGRWKPAKDQVAEDANRAITLNPDGSQSVNPLWVAARAAAAGLPTTGYQTTRPAPQAGPSPEALMSQARTIGQGQADPSTLGAPPPAGKTSDGRPVWLVNGKYYDNPEGR